jgi:hypothetical protein
LAGETNHIRGGLYIDQTGTWGYDLIAVSGEGIPTDGSRSIWRIHSPTNYYRLAVITNETQLESILTVPNQPQYGPWAGRLLAGAEYTWRIFAVDTNGTVDTFDTYNIFTEPIAPSDMDIVPSNQDLYCTLQQPSLAGQGLVLKIPRTVLTNNIGDIVITQSGENVPNYLQPNGRLFFLRWDASPGKFNIQMIFVPLGSEGVFEHSSFAPFDVEPLMP